MTMTKTEQEIVDELRLLSPADLAKVFALAYTIRAAHDAGDLRPAKVIVAPLLRAGELRIH
jgi:hypothetical protein